MSSDEEIINEAYKVELMDLFHNARLAATSNDDLTKALPNARDTFEQGLKRLRYVRDITKAVVKE